MQTLVPLFVVAVAACAIARPPGPTPAPVALEAQEEPPNETNAPPPPAPPREYLGEYLPPRFLLPHYLRYEESPRLPPPVPEQDWLNKEIYRIKQMEEEADSENFHVNSPRWIAQGRYIRPMFETPVIVQENIEFAAEPIPPNFGDLKSSGVKASEPTVATEPRQYQQESKRGPTEPKPKTNTEQMTFALTPLDIAFYEPVLKPKIIPIENLYVHHEGEGEPKVAMLEPPRQIRQNPNLNKQKNLVETESDRIKAIIAFGDRDATGQPGIRVLEAASDAPLSIYGIAVIAAVGAAMLMVVVGFAFGWYTLAKKAKAAADVDYPAYGVTGPTIDASGDRKLAHSAHMYHYQHQKQQILAMERNGLEQRTGSVSDPESEEENEEGDYTVYECPGFATTGDMEVKNPLFSEDPTPATPGKCEVVKPQPKD